MAEQGDKNTEISDAKADGDAGEKLGKLMDMMSDACSKMDAVGARLDGFEDRFAKADARMDALSKKDEGEDEKKEEAKADAEAEEKGEPKDVVADKRKDAEEEKSKADAEDDKDKEDAKADAAALRSGMAGLQAEIARVASQLPKALSDSEREAFSTIQAAADPVYQAFGARADTALVGETPLAYKRRLAVGLQKHSPKWAKARLSAIPDEDSLDPIIADVYADALTAARRGVDLAPGQLRAVTHQSGGHTIITYEGSTPGWMNDFAGNSQRATGRFNTPN